MYSLQGKWNTWINTWDKLAIQQFCFIMAVDIKPTYSVSREDGRGWNKKYLGIKINYLCSNVWGQINDIMMLLCYTLLLVVTKT